MAESRDVTYLLVLTFLLICMEAETQRTQTAVDTTTPNQRGQGTPTFAPDEMYLDILPLTSRNFTKKVMKSKETWIIIFHKGMLSRSWKRMAISLRGQVWHGMIDQLKEKKLIESLKLNATTHQALVYPHGGKLVKQKYYEYAESPMEAKMKAVKAIPDRTQRLKPEDVRDFLMESFASTPSRFPLLYLTNEAETSSLIKALAIRFEKFFHFGIMFNPTFEDLKKIGIKGDYLDFPSLIVMVAKAEQNKLKDLKMDLSAVVYNTAEIGELTYPNAAKFLFAVNREYRFQLPGDNQANQKETAEMLDVVNTEKQRFRIVNSELDKKTEEKEEEEKKSSKQIGSDPYAPNRDEL